MSIFHIFGKKAAAGEETSALDHQPVVVKTTMGSVDITDTAPKTIQMLKANQLIDGNTILEPGTPEHNLYVTKTMVKVQYPNLGPNQVDAIAKRITTGEPTEEALTQRNTIAKNAAIKNAALTKEATAAAVA